ncbi:MAG: tyrosine-protein phosphatase [Bacteroidales bacterium]|jgi:protein-tyrosine phosphatase|nr:tyrosine-protein phosphatase [Bacteroidales bacterium]
MKTNVFLFMTFFLPVTVHAQPRPVVNREVKLEGAINFRDIGGYETTASRRIALGRIYRSADISQLTDNDMAELKRRKIYTVVDFRSEEEAANAPDKLLPGADYLSLPSDSSANSTLHGQNHPSGTDAMMAFYSDIAHFKEQYRPFFRKALTLPDTSALLFHCTAGKDRTGIAAALFLYAMDVPAEVIFSDYAVSDFFLKDRNEEIISEMVKTQGIDRETARRLTEANPQYLQATFNAIMRKYGSMESFLRLELGINENVKLLLREKYLQ